MSVQDCELKVRKYLKDKGLHKEIPESRVQEMARFVEMAAVQAQTPAELSFALQQMVEETQARWRQKNQLMNEQIIVQRERALDSLKKNREQWKANIAEGGKGDPKKMGYEAFRSWVLGGSLRPGVESNLSVEKIRNSVEGQIRDVFNRGMEPIKDVVASGKLDREILQELDALYRGTKEMQSGSQVALQAAKVIKATQDKIFQYKQAYNPFMELASDYRMKRFHDRERITNADRDEWTASAMRTYGKKSFPYATPQEKLEIFADIYDRIVDGTFGTIVDDSASDKYLTVSGIGGNIARRMARGRQLVAENWELEWEYISAYGPKTLSEGVDRVIRNSSRDIAQLTKFGTNPEGMFQGLMARYEKTLKGEEAEFFRDNKRDLERAFEVAMGAQDVPAKGLQAKLVSGAMTATYLAKTGGAFLRSLPDMALSASLMRSTTGESIFSVGPEIVLEYAKALGSTKYREARLADLGLFAKSAHRELMRTLGSPDGTPGFATKALEKIGTLNLLNRHTDAMKSATATVLSKWAADIAGTKWEGLHAKSKQAFLRYGIGELEWKVMRSAVDHVDGLSLMTPEAIRAISDTSAEVYLRASKQFTGEKATKPMLDRARFQLALKYGTMINEMADLSTSSPDLRQKDFFFGDSTINEGRGQAWRLFMQFKSASAVSGDVFRRNYFSGNGPKGDLSGMAQHILLGSFLWGVGEYASQFFSGKTPEDFRRPEFAAKAFVGSGAGGLMMDYIAQPFRGEGVPNSALVTGSYALGPVIGQAVELGSIGAQFYKSARDGSKPPTRQLSGFLLEQIPGQNLFYTKALFNYYLANQAQEFFGRGYLNALERRTREVPGLLEDQQRYFMGRPTSPKFLEQ